jgi:poly-beta-1,6-N-acetyl-D-glucosamine synthase
MAQYLLWIISYFSLYIAIVWLILIYINDDKPERSLKRYPSVTIIVPAHNEAQGIKETVLSLVALDYPTDQLQVLVIDDGSTDDTATIIDRLAQDHPMVSVIHKRNEGKAVALNSGLCSVSTEYFACVDADSRVDPVALKRIIPYFSKGNTAAVISAVKVDQPRTIYEKLQMIEYLIAIQARRVMASIDTLALTPGVLSVYKTEVVRTIGCFDEKSIVEDYEIALKLKYHGYNIQIAPDAVSYTKVPHNFVKLWRQRIRWYRGFIDTNLKYRDMFFSKKYGLFGWFQMPFNVVGVIMLIIAIAIISYEMVMGTVNFIVRSVRIDNYFVTHVLELPTFKDFWLSQDMKIMLPLYVGLAASLLLLFTAYRLTHERLRNPFSLWAYLFLTPYLFVLHWLGTFYEKIFRVKQRW